MDRALAVLAIAALALVCLTLSPRPAPGIFGKEIDSFLFGLNARGIYFGFSSISYILMGAAIVTILAYIVYLYLESRKAGYGKSEAAPRYRKRIVLALVLTAIAAFFFAPQRQPPADDREKGPTVAGTPPGRPILPPSSSSPQAPKPEYLLPAAQPLILAGAIATLLIIVVLAARRFGRHSPSEEKAETPAAAIREIRRRLELGDELRDAIIACYADMVAIFSDSPGPPSLTAREFAMHLRSGGVAEPEILELTAIFEKARYSNEACVEDDRRRAARALESIEAAYGREAG